MTLKERLRRTWRAAKRALGLSTPGWDGPPKDEAHALYRQRYEAFVEGLPALPRVKNNETTEKYYALAQTLQMLHEYGDDPILPPGIRRRVITENRTRLAALGEVEQPSFLGRIMASLAPFFPYILIGGLLLSVTGWGAGIVNGWRADRFEHQRDEARIAAQTNAEAAQRWQERSEEYRQGLIDAANVARNAAAALEAERAADARRAARERRRTREIANVLTHSPDAPEWRLRDDPAAEDQPPSP